MENFDINKPVKFNSSNLDEAVFTDNFDEAVPALGIGAMKITFKKGDEYIYYPMNKQLYAAHIKLMLERGVSAGEYFRKNIMNMFKSKKL